MSYRFRTLGYDSASELDVISLVWRQFFTLDMGKKESGGSHGEVRRKKIRQRISDVYKSIEIEKLKNDLRRF